MLRPLHDRIVIRRKAPDTTSKGGIVLPSTRAETSLEGTVLAIGPEVKNPSIRPDVQVVFHKLSQVRQFDGEEIIVANEDQILAIYE